MPHALARFALLALALHAAGARAADADPPIFTFSAFGTLGIVHSSGDQADFSGTPTKPRGAGHSGAWSAEPDSILAGQVNARFTDRLSAVLQFDTEQTEDHTYRPDIEWANLKYQFTPEFSARVGRTVLGGLLLSSTRKVAYAYPWVRPPIEVYNQIPVTFSDGIDGSYRTALGAATNTVQVSLGRTDSEFPDAVSKARRLLVVTDTLEHGFGTANVSYGQVRITIPEFEALTGGFRQFGPEGEALAGRYDMNDRVVRFYALGAGYDPGSWFVTGEWIRVAGGGIIGTRSGWYLGGGHRFGKWTPYAAYARAKADNLSDPGLDTARLPAFLVDPATELNAGLNALLASKMVQDTLSLGVRWDVARNAAFKLQFDRTRVGTGSNGSLTNLQPGFRTGGRFSVISASVDFVFR